MKKGFFWITLLLIAATILGGCNTTPTVGEADGAEEVLFEYTTYELDGERFITLTKYIGEDTDVTVPTAIDGLTVTEIGAECFAGSAVVSVTVPDTVIVADTNAFAECKALKSVTLPDNMLYLGAQAFLNCESLKEITLPATGVTEYSWGMFLGSGLEKITLREGIEILPANMFLGCALTEITLPASVTKIMPGALGCESLTKVYFEGDAPAMTDTVLTSSEKPFTVSYRSGAAGFDDPTWAAFPKEVR